MAPLTDLKQGDFCQLELDNIAYGGDSVGRLSDGLTVFAAGGIPGETVKAEIIEKKKNYARAQVREVLRSSDNRVKPRCPVYGSCGGCQFQHMDYSTQLQAKKKIVNDSLERIGHFESVDISDVIGADYPWYYRNKAQFPLGYDETGNIAAGFYQRESHDLVIHQKCFIQHQLINRLQEETIKILNQYELSVYDEQTQQGLLRHLVIRTGVCTNQAVVVLVTSNKDFPEGEEIAAKLMSAVPELVGVAHNIQPQQSNVILGSTFELLAGKMKFQEYLKELKFEISPASFFQVNTLQTIKLYDVIQRLAGLQGDENIIDAYCGMGTIGLYLTEQANQVWGIEENKQAVRDARINAQLNQIDNCKFMSASVEKKLPELISQEINPDLLIVDPPRKGLSETFRSVLKKMEVKKVIYVSCNPATLARDLKDLSEKFMIEQIQPVDMFPQTYHVETVSLLSIK